MSVRFQLHCQDDELGGLIEGEVVVADQDERQATVGEGRAEGHALQVVGLDAQVGFHVQDQMLGDGGEGQRRLSEAKKSGRDDPYAGPIFSSVARLCPGGCGPFNIARPERGFGQKGGMA